MYVCMYVCMYVECAAEERQVSRGTEAAREHEDGGARAQPIRSEDIPGVAYQGSLTIHS